MQRITLVFASTVISLVLAACGGGGSDSLGTDNPGNNTGQTEPPIWTFNQFSPSSQFINYCATPRTGTDQFNNDQPYPDKVGTAMHEKMWLRSFTNETYLWYDEVIDNDPAQFDTVTDYFEQLKTNQKTPSGNDKDQFHFYESYDSFQKQAQAGFTTGYGIRWAVISTLPPRNFTVAAVEPNSPAAAAGIQRGDKVLSIDGINFISSSDSATLNAGLSPAQSEQHEFVFEDQAGNQKSVTLTSVDFKTSPIQNAQIINYAGKQVGYVQFNQFIPTAQDGLIEAFNLFKTRQIDDLILDMRYNGGGRVIMAAQLGYMIAGNNSLNKTFTFSTLNDKRTAEEERTEFESRVINWAENTFTSTNLPTVSLPRVYILSSRGTASASENVINGLRGIDVEVFLIGTTTRGKPYGFVPAQNCGTVYYTIQFGSENAKGFDDYADGFTPSGASSNGEIGLSSQVPGCIVADDFSESLGSQNEDLLAAALSHIDTGKCPETIQSAPRLAPTQYGQGDRSGNAVTLPHYPLRDNAILLKPKESQ
ncbi:PDZ domain-containing protein [Pseudoalteromonas sp. McH1-7]|uniref:S41 family peptidase n=1 Tax=Pseudoalteromonas sp. McH1-7 TaxID=2745574 RepID=UPI001591BD42|nr:S41 family peptidase [Pseudoalteromonas sp. McH1-7]NUZ12135.1 PDZ domain-containing protein [Pseudoalteromonas sp. McH1-7]